MTDFDPLDALRDAAPDPELDDAGAALLARILAEPLGPRPAPEQATPADEMPDDAGPGTGQTT